jgi:hypothetical protein
MKPSEILTAARDLISDPERWCHGASARTSNGVSTMPCSPVAAQWCAVGACEKAHSGFIHVEALDVLNKSARLHFKLGAAAVNDDLGHAAVMEMYDKAIEIAKREEEWK